MPKNETMDRKVVALLVAFAAVTAMNSTPSAAYTIYIPEGPQNTVAVAGETVTLGCTSDNGGSMISWYGDGVFTTTGYYIAGNCVVDSGYTSSYSTNMTEINQCDLNVINATVESSGLYACYEDQDWPYGYLVVLESNPVCTYNVTGNSVDENAVVVMSCFLSYYDSSMTANMTWSGEGCTPLTSYVNNTFAMSSVTVVAQRPKLSTCTCTTQFNAPQNVIGASNAPNYSYTWSAPADIAVPGLEHCVTVSLSGSWSSTDVIMARCSDSFGAKFRNSFQTIVGRVNGAISRRELCTSSNGQLSVSIGQTQFKFDEHYAGVNFNVVIRVNDPSRIPRAAACATEVKQFVQNMNTWRKPIIPSTHGCIWTADDQVSFNWHETKSGCF